MISLKLNEWPVVQAGPTCGKSVLAVKALRRNSPVFDSDVILALIMAEGENVGSIPYAKSGSEQRAVWDLMARLALSLSYSISKYYNVPLVTNITMPPVMAAQALTVFRDPETLESIIDGRKKDKNADKPNKGYAKSWVASWEKKNHLYRLAYKLVKGEYLSEVFGYDSGDVPEAREELSKYWLPILRRDGWLDGFVWDVIAMDKDVRQSEGEVGKASTESNISYQEVSGYVIFKKTGDKIQQEDWSFKAVKGTASEVRNVTGWNDKFKLEESFKLPEITAKVISTEIYRNDQTGEIRYVEVTDQKGIFGVTKLFPGESTVAGEVIKNPKFVSMKVFKGDLAKVKSDWRTKTSFNSLFISPEFAPVPIPSAISFFAQLSSPASKTSEPYAPTNLLDDTSKEEIIQSIINGRKPDVKLINLWFDEEVGDIVKGWDLKGKDGSLWEFLSLYGLIRMMETHGIQVRNFPFPKPKSIVDLNSEFDTVFKMYETRARERGKKGFLWMRENYSAFGNFKDVARVLNQYATFKTSPR